VLLGSRTLAALHGHLGDVVPVRLGQSAEPMRIVGTGVFPDLGDLGQLGRGAAMTHEGLRRITSSAPRNLFLVRFASGTDVAAESRRMRKAMAPVRTTPPRKPADLVNFGDASNLPTVLVVMFATAGMATLANMLVSSVRRRRRELAVLRVLGFVPHQVIATVAWEATTITIIAAAIGLPLGVIGGRWSWSAVAHQLGIAYQPVVPRVTLVVVGLVTVLGVNIVALIPARFAGRVVPATASRAE